MDEDAFNTCQRAVPDPHFVAHAGIRVWLYREPEFHSFSDAVDLGGIQRSRFIDSPYNMIDARRNQDRQAVHRIEATEHITREQWKVMLPAMSLISNRALVERQKLIESLVAQPGSY